MIDAILSHHSNSHTCGVAKFNQRLAKELGVPLLPLDQSPIFRPLTPVRHPLISVMDCEDPDWAPRAMRYKPFDLFLHDMPVVLTQYWSVVTDAVHAATVVYAANAHIAEQLRPIRSDVIESWCPATIQGNPTRGRINVLTFGMAHKIQTARYEKLKTLLDGTGEDYTVSLSTAVHEGTPWDLTATVPEKLRAIFGDRLRYLGYLADDALAHEFTQCTAMALFYDPALRANNTTYHAAVDAGKPILTNLDQYSPGTTAHDIDTLTTWPTTHVRSLSNVATWAELLHQLRQPVSV